MKAEVKPCAEAASLKTALWKKVADEGLTLVSSADCTGASATQEEATEFLKKAMAPPQAPAAAPAPVVEDDDDDDDDLFESMD
jgi:hypothetical protein